MTELSCCREPLRWLVAEARSTRNVSPLSWQLWRCTRCEKFKWQLDHHFESLPCVRALFTHLRELRAEAAERAYAAPESLHTDGRGEK
jgi:hypothetical protein